MAVDYANVTGHRTDAEAPRYGRNADGYGRKIPTRHWVQLDGGTRWRRVYVVQFANAGSAYVTVNGKDLYLNDHDLA